MLAASVFHCFHCPGCGEPIPLPHQSLLGTSEGLLYVPSGVWPIRLLCSRFLRVHEVHPVMIRLAAQADVERFARTHPLWGIECECALEGCGKRHTLYTTCLRGTEPAFVSRMLLKANPSVACLGLHPAKFREGRMRAYRLD